MDLRNPSHFPGEVFIQRVIKFVDDAAVSKGSKEKELFVHWLSKESPSHIIPILVALAQGTSGERKIGGKAAFL